jgi:hypothetical protein
VTITFAVLNWRLSLPIAKRFIVVKSKSSWKTKKQTEKQAETQAEVKTTRCLNCGKEFEKGDGVWHRQFHLQELDDLCLVFSDDSKSWFLLHLPS